MVDCPNRVTVAVVAEGVLQWKMWGNLSASALQCGMCQISRRELSKVSFIRNNTMEEDRAATNLGEAADAAASIEPEVVPRVPKKRFIGRRAAAGKAGTAGELNVTVEGSGAIQGIRCQAKCIVSPTYWVFSCPA